jgi:exopolysaccharide biosynthesis polyprenyl glycosylphosphotransferase
MSTDTSRAIALAESETLQRRGWHRPLLRMTRRGFGPDLAEVRQPIRAGNKRRDVMRREATFRRSLAAANAWAAGAAALLCVVVGVGGGAGLRAPAVLALPPVIVAARALGLYDRDGLVVNNATIDEAPRLFQLATLYTLLFALLAGVFTTGRLAPSQLLALWGAMFGLGVAARAVARTSAHAVTEPERCLLVGTETAADRLRAKLTAAGGHAVLAGRMTMGDKVEAVDVSEAVAVLHDLVVRWRIQRVVIEPSEPQPQATLDFVREAKETGVRVSLLPRILEVVGSSIEVDDVHGLTLLGVRQFGLSRSSAVLKRSLDLVVGGVILVALAPLLAVIALLIRRDSPGPVIYLQTRVGREGRLFTMFKFRTMVDGADALKPTLRALNESDGLFKIADDPRITRVGRILRHYSLDELPQLINVVRGEMSLVGPRPLVRDDDVQITGLDRRRLHLTPGMTGRWQILGSARVPLAEMIKLDYLYVTGWSLWSDVKILLRTVPYVLARRGM